MNRKAIVLVTGLAVVAAAWMPADAFAASPVSPTDGLTVKDTHTPKFVVQLDTTMQADGQPTDYLDSVGISVIGPDGRGGTTVVAFCNAIDMGNGRVGCSDAAHPLANGTYLWEFMYRTHTCIPPISPITFPSCSFAFFPHVVGAVFSVNVSPPPPPPEPTDTNAPRLTVYGTSGVRGHAVKLRFSVHDDSGRAEIVLGVYRAGRAVATHHYGLQRLDGVYSTSWTPRVRGSYRFCVVAQDGAGNRSPTRCSTVGIR